MKKIIKYFLVLVTLLFSIGLYFITQNETNRFSKYIKDNFSTEFKLFLKENLFYYFIQYRELKFKASQYDIVIKDLEKVTEQKEILENKLNSGKFEDTNLEEYRLRSLIIPYVSKNNLKKNKKSGYLDIYLDNLVIVFGNGNFVYLNKKDFLNNNVLIKNLPTNLDSQKLFNNEIKWTGIKDLKIVNQNVYISLTEEIKKNCYATSVFFAEFNINFLEFKKIFSPEECVESEREIKAFKFFNGYQTGGRLIWLNNKIYLSTGDYNNWRLPQDNQSTFGKIIEIDPISHAYKIVAKGFRNPQGLELYSDDKDYLILTDHGPKGGDEINIINLGDGPKINNFGWPIASYGEHYDVFPINKFTKEFAPLKKNHKTYNFKEPTYWFKESIGISEVKKNFFSTDSEFIVTSLKNKSLYFFKIDINKKTQLTRELKINERIRDIIYDKDLHSYFIYLEDSPKLVMISVR